MIVSKSKLPKKSILSIAGYKSDYNDSYSFHVENNQITIRDLYLSIFAKAPKWVNFLMSLRNRIVGIFGIKTESKPFVKTTFEVGDKVGIFKIYNIQEHEIIAGEDDKHLSFRVSVYKSPNATILVSTLVKYHNVFGRIYFFIVAPFHKLIVKNILKKSAKEINK
ncbi:MAG: DUF2867 domain-containing protein [Saprospiraceae bacterium]